MGPHNHRHHRRPSRHPGRLPRHRGRLSRHRGRLSRHHGRRLQRLRVRRCRLQRKYEKSSLECLVGD